MPWKGRQGRQRAPAKYGARGLHRTGKGEQQQMPGTKTAAVLSGQTNLAAHNNKEMPVWGAVCWRLSGGHEAEVQQRIANLNHQIESLQAKITPVSTSGNRTD